MSNSRLQKPGSTGVSAGISSGLLGVKTISFGDVPTAWPEDHVMRHVVVIVVSLVVVVGAEVGRRVAERRLGTLES